MKNSNSNASVRHEASAVAMQDLADVIASLRAPDGCPWDRAQTHQTLARYAVEEVYELVDAIEAADDAGLREELGDVLLQVVLHAQLADERGAFSLQDVADTIRDKMLRRHPHVFADADAEDTAAVERAWAEAKRREGKGTLDGVPRAMPPIDRAVRLSDRAARVGFDFPDVAAALDKLHEETAELVEAVATGDVAAVQDELGDTLFAAVNVGRKAGVSPADALRGTLDKFATRFASIEAALAEQGRAADDATLEELEALWQRAKQG